MTSQRDVFDGIETLLVFACYDEDQDLSLKPHEFGDLLRDMGVTSFFSYNKLQKFIDDQFENADANGDGKVSLLEFETYFPDLLAYAKMQSIKVQVPTRLNDREYVVFAEQQRTALEKIRDAEMKDPRHKTGEEKTGAKVKVTEEGAFLLGKIRPKIEEARSGKKQLEDELREAILLRDKLVRQTVSVKTKKDTELGTMEARLAELQGKRDEAKTAREIRMKEAEIARSKAIALVSAIPPRDLQEMKKMNHPPHSIKKTLEAVYLLLEPPASAEAEIKRILGTTAGSKFRVAASTLVAAKAAKSGEVGSKFSATALSLMKKTSSAKPSEKREINFEKVVSRIAGTDFVHDLTSFEYTSEAVVNYIDQIYVNGTDGDGTKAITLEAVERASKAAGPLWQWVTTQVQAAPARYACEAAKNNQEEKAWQTEIQQLLKSIAMLKLGRMDGGKINSFKADQVAAVAKIDLKKCEAKMGLLESDVAAMQGVIEKGTKIEKHILAGGDPRDLVW